MPSIIIASGLLLLLTFFWKVSAVIWRFRKVMFHKLSDWWGTYGCGQMTPLWSWHLYAWTLYLACGCSFHQIKWNHIIVRFRQGQIFTCSLELRMDLPVIQRAYLQCFQESHQFIWSNWIWGQGCYIWCRGLWKEVSWRLHNCSS